jgi:hypothetical protein
MARAPLLLLLAAVCLLSFAGAGANAAGRKMVGVYELGKGDFSVKVTNWGATVTSVVFPDSKGMLHAYSILLHPWTETPVLDFASVRGIGSDAFLPAIYWEF